MEELGLAKGALLVVDRSKTAGAEDLVLIRHEGQFYCRVMCKREGRTVFTNGKDEITPLAGETEIIGVVTASIHQRYSRNAVAFD
jgi:SOS-response transcriptional repressor LexA